MNYPTSREIHAAIHIPCTENMSASEIHPELCVMV
jgi:hypothetical protein